MTGVYFNDNTKLIRDRSGVNLVYFVRRGANRVDDVEKYSTGRGGENVPREIQKKELLLKHFFGYLEGTGAQKDDEF